VSTWFHGPDPATRSLFPETVRARPHHGGYKAPR
jgi:hypothetical protein